MTENLIHFCDYFHAATYIPIVILSKDGAIQKTFPNSLQTDIFFYPAELQNNLIHLNKNPHFFVSKKTSATYGKVQNNQTGDLLIIGPVFDTPVQSDTIMTYIREHKIPNEMKEEITNFLQNIPLENRFQFINQLIFLNFCLNKTRLKSEDYFHIDSTINKNRTTTYTAKNIEIKENANFHNTYLLEQKMYDYVRRGEKEKLKKFLLSATKNQLIKEGILASNPLRQAKNIFLSGITKIGTLGAIRGGMDVEETYQLMDLYAQECEKLTDVNSIRNLNLVALEDFCNRVYHSRLPKKCSKEILIAINFINNSTNKPIQVTDVSQYVHRSPSYLSKKFKQEMGISIGKYILHSKLEDAKHLLLYSEMSLSEISNYLCFSSQSYFQNVFKKNLGTTPAKYKNNHSFEQL